MYKILLSKKSRIKKPKKYIKFLDRTVAILGALNAIATMPQVLEIWIGKDATGVSTITWSYYCLLASFLLLYGLVHRQAPIVITYSVSLITYVAILLGSIIY